MPISTSPPFRILVRSQGAAQAAALVFAPGASAEGDADDFRAYRILRHQHTPEIERALEGLRKKGCVVDPIELNVVE